jgi:TetR/AcrR family transcriptional repressor of lmrAB and yxaGH operons
MTDGMQRHGLHGTGLSEVLRDAGAPKGVLYHHFPEGKTGLAVASIHASIDQISTWLDVAFAKYPDPLEAIERWVRAASRRLSETDFDAGCPLATVALETTAADVEVRGALGTAFADLRGRIAAALDAQGFAGAAGMAALIVATYEGALLQARVDNSIEPLRLSSEALMGLLRAQRGLAA